MQCLLRLFVALPLSAMWIDCVHLCVHMNECVSSCFWTLSAVEVDVPWEKLHSDSSSFFPGKQTMSAAKLLTDLIYQTNCFMSSWCENKVDVSQNSVVLPWKAGEQWCSVPDGGASRGDGTEQYPPCQDPQHMNSLGNLHAATPGGGGN